MNKRLLALIVAVIFIIGSIATGFAATFEDVVDTDFEDEVNRLVALEIISGYPDGTFRPEGLVTRAEFAKITVTATGVGAAAEYAKGATKFTDVAAEHWAAGYINVATDLGIIQGYGDGRFGPEDQVTYAEAITMIVRSLGYEPAAQAKGGYPGGYLAVAAENDITDGITVLANVAANRGDIAVMVDNSLEVDMMVQDGFGDRPTWKVEKGETLLSKLGVDEIKGEVTAIARVNDKLEDNEIVVEWEEDGEDYEKTYELVSKENPEALFGLGVKLLVKNKKVVHAEVDTDAKDVLVDTVATAVYDGYGFELKVADKKYALEEGFELYVNFKEGEIEDFNNYELDEAEKMYYGTFILDGKKVKFANLFKFEEENIGLVTDVAKDEIEYEAVSGNDVLELDEYDDVYVYNKDFTAASLDDIDEDSVIYYWTNDDDEVFVIVVNDVVKGEVTRARENKVRIDGKNYDAGAYAMVSTDKGKKFGAWDSDKVYDLVDEKVTVYLDLNGDILAIVGEADVTSDTLYGVATWYEKGRKPVVTIFTQDGKEVDYYFEDKDADAEVVEDAKDSETGWIYVKYELNSDGEIAKDTLKKVDSGIKLYKDADKKFATTEEKNAGDRYYITKDTVVMKVYDGTDFDPAVIEYDELVKMKLEDNSAIVEGTAGKNAKFIVFTDEDFAGVKDDIYFGVVTDDEWKVGSNRVVEIDVFGEGKVDFKVPAEKFGKGDLLTFTLDSKDKVNKYLGAKVNAAKLGAEFGDVSVVANEVYEVDGNFITLEGANGDTYRVLDGAKLYNVKKDGNRVKLDSTVRLSRIKGIKDEAETQIILLLDKNGEVRAALVNPTDHAWENGVFGN